MSKITPYPYLVLLTASFLFVGAAWKLGYIDLKNNTEMFPAQEIQTEEVIPSETMEFPPPSTEVSNDSASETADATTVEEPEIEASPFFTADRSYFDDALFIGDSRTVGLYEYGDLGNAVVLADSGMSVYKIFKQEFSLRSGEKMNLEEILLQKQFGKIYIMLGINELGYSFDQTVHVYKDMVSTIESFQPNALIFLQANLHITEKKSSTSSIYNNDNINRFNNEIQKMTDSVKRFYLDANELFDDENGNLSVEFTVDESHVLGKYYADWVDWLLQYAVTAAKEQ